MTEAELHEKLRKLANNTSIGCDWRAEEHFQAARRWSSVHRWLSLPAAVIAAATGATIIANSKDESLVLIGGILALVVAALTAASGVLTPEEQASQHKKAFDGFASLRTRFLVFRDVTLKLQRSGEELQKELTSLLDKRDELAAAVPEPPMWARRKVKSLREKRKRAGIKPDLGSSLDKPGE